MGITRSDSMVHLHKLDFHVRADLDAVSPRCLAVLHPLRLTLTNLAPDFHEHVPAKVGPCCGCLLARGMTVAAVSSPASMQKNAAPEDADLAACPHML